MAEHQVTVDGTTHVLPDPFFVIATQSPVDLAGTYPLPDSQLDRLLLRLTLGYPDENAERALLAGSDRRGMIAQTLPVSGPDDAPALRRAAGENHPRATRAGYLRAPQAP